MPRPIVLHSGPFVDLPLKELAARAASWGYGGLELATVGDHLNVRSILVDNDYAGQRLSFLANHDLQVTVIEAVGEDTPIVDVIRAAQRLGAAVVAGNVGTSIQPFVEHLPDQIDRVFHEFAAKWHPILDVCQEAGIRFACEVKPGGLAFDYYSAERLLDAIDRRPEFGLCVNPAHLHWQGVDTAAFVRHFGDRIYHVQLCDVAIKLDGRAGLLNSHLPDGDARRGWEFRSPGRGGVDWENFMRALNAVGYAGPLSVDWHDAGLDRDFGAADAGRFAKQLDFPGRQREEPPAFR